MLSRKASRSRLVKATVAVLSSGCNRKADSRLCSSSIARRTLIGVSFSNANGISEPGRSEQTRAVVSHN